MLDFEIRRRLRRLFGGPAPLRPEHAGELEAELLARFDQLYPGKKVVPMRRLWMKRVFLAAAAVCVAGVAACVAPADMDVVVGRRVTVRVPDGVAMPEPDALVPLVEGKGNEQKIMVRVRGEPGAKTIELDVWADAPPEGSAAERIRARYPALAAAEIHEELLEGTVRETLGKKLGHEILDLDVVDKKDKEKARQQIMAQLAAQGVDGKVDVEVEGDGDVQTVDVKGGDARKGRRVKVRVQRGEEAPAQEK
jgi:hypothetical protein